MKKNYIKLITIFSICLVAFTGMSFAANIERSDGTPVTIDQYPNSVDEITSAIESGGHIIIPCGTYSLTTYVEVQSNSLIEGSGNCTIFSLADDSGFDSTDGASDIVIRDLSFEGNGNSANAIKFSGTNNANHVNLLVDNVQIRNLNSTAIVFNGTGLTITNSKLLGVFNGITIERYPKLNNITIKIIGNEIISGYNSPSGSEWGEGIDCNIHENNPSYCHIENNYVEGFREEVIDANAYTNYIINNKLVLYGDSRGTNGIFCHSSIENVSCIVTGNEISGDAVSNTDYIDLGSRTGNSIVSNNKITGNGLGDGIVVQNNNGNIIVSHNLLNNLAVGINNDLTLINSLLLDGNIYEDVSDNVQTVSGASYKNKTYVSPDGTEWNCGVSNGGTFSCS